jgi:hypothetical protein
MSGLLVVLLVTVLVAGGCGGDTTNISIPTPVQGQCSQVVIITGGVVVPISGNPGQSVTVGPTTYTFAPDCSVTTTTTSTTTGHPA